MDLSFWRTLVGMSANDMLRRAAPEDAVGTVDAAAEARLNGGVDDAGPRERALGLTDERAVGGTL